MIVLRIIDPNLTLTLISLQKLVISTKPMFYYILYLANFFLFILIPYSFIYGSLARHISSVLTLMLAVSFIDGPF
jgi:hypothetical protein